MASQKSSTTGAAKSSASSATRAGTPLAVQAARVLLLVAIGLSCYLAVASFSSGGIAGCGPEGGCGEVLRSRWAYWLGIPVSVPAGLMYLGLLGLTFKVARSASSGMAKGAKLALQAGCLIVVGAAIWFVGLQAFAVGKFCPFCCTTHGAAAVAAVLLLRWVAPMPGADLTSAFAAGAVALGVMAAGQLMVQPKTFMVAGMASPPAAAAVPTNPVVVAQTSSVTAAQTPSRVAAVPERVPAPTGATVAAPKPVAAPPVTPEAPTLSLHRDRFRLDLTEFPLIGSPKAPRVMVSLFDYTCKYCRATHGPILEVQRAFSNELAVLTLPMPLDAGCNRYVRQTPAAHSNACDYASLGLAVWRADPAKFHLFDDWLMGTLPRTTLDQARLQAAALVGGEKLDRALADPWVGKTIQLAIDIYGANNESIRSGNMPQMIIGTNIMAGTIHNSGELYGLVERGLGLKRP